jgi:hypothetical protein
MTLEWLALLATVALACRLSRVRNVRYHVAVVGLFLVAGSFVWRFHVERGQYYVFISLLLTGGTSLLIQRRGEHVGSGVLFGLAMAMRPPVALLLLPLWWGGLRRTSLAALVTAASAVALTLPWAGVSTWQGYFWMAGEWEKAMLDYPYLSRTYVKLPPAKEVDGYREDALELRGGSVTVGFLLGRAYWRSPEHVPAVVMNPAFQKVCFLGVLALWCLGHYLARRVRPFTARETMLSGIWLLVLADYFLPMRVEYADVLYLLPMALAMPLLARKTHRAMLLLLILAWLPVVLLPAPAFRNYWICHALLRGVLLLGVCGLPVFGPWARRLRQLRLSQVSLRGLAARPAADRGC